MSDKRIIKLNELLTVLRSEVPGTKGAFVINPDGFILASDIEFEIDHYETGKFFSILEKKGAKLSEKTLRSPLIRVAIWSDKGDIQFFPLRNSIYLVVLSDFDSRPGLLLLRITKIIEIFNKIIDKRDE